MRNSLRGDFETELFGVGVDASVFAVGGEDFARTHEGYPARVGKALREDFSRRVELFDTYIAGPGLFGGALEVELKFGFASGKLRRNIGGAGDYGVSETIGGNHDFAVGGFDIGFAADFPF